MNTLTIFVCTLCFVSYTLVRGDGEAEVPQRCMEKVGISIADVPSLMRDRSEDGIRIRSCLTACYLQKLGLMIENSINMEKIDAHLDKILETGDNEQEIRQAIHQCADEAANDDECIVAKNFAGCGFNHMKIRIQNMLQ